MTDSIQILKDLAQARVIFPYYVQIVIMVDRAGILKTRLIIHPETFVQVLEI